MAYRNPEVKQRIISVLDEGGLVVKNPNSLDFVGDGVTGTGVGNDVTENIPGGSSALLDYLYLPGRVGGQTAYGGAAASDNLRLSSTAHATKGSILLGDKFVYDEVNGRVAIGKTTATENLDVVGTGAFSGNVGIGAASNSAYRLYVMYNGVTTSVAQYSGVVYSGTGQECKGSYGQAYGVGTHTSARAVGGRFEAIDYKLNRSTGSSTCYGGWFSSRERTGTFVAGATHTFIGGYFQVNAAIGDWTTNNPSVFTYGCYIAGTPTGYGSNHTHWSIYSLSGNNYFGGNIGIGIAVPTAVLHLKAGTATAGTAPLKFISGTDLTTPEAGVLEYNGNHLAFSPRTARRQVMLTDTEIISDLTVANTTVETIIFSESIGANELYIGQTLGFETCGIYSTVNASDTFTLRVKLGGVTVSTITSTPKNVTNTPFNIRFKGTVRAIGSSGTIMCGICIMLDNIGASVANTAASSVNTTVSNDLTVTIQWDSANAGNTLTRQIGYSEFIN